MTYREYSSPFPPFIGIIRILVICNLLIWILQIIPSIGVVVTDYLSLDPLRAMNGQVWRFLSYGFLHDPHSPMHLLFNMLALWMFGTAVLDRWSELKFLLFYIGAILFSGIISVLYTMIGANPMIIGASGGVLGVMALFTFFYPQRELLLFGFFPIRAWVALTLFAIISVGGMISGGGAVAHLTHLGGIGFAFFWIYLEPKLLGFNWPARKKKTVIHYFEPRKSRQELFEEKSQIDEVLKKISESGMDSLTESELRILEKASGKPIPRN